MQEQTVIHSDNVREGGRTQLTLARIIQEVNCIRF